MEDKDLKKKEQKAFWIGVGSIVAGICLIIGFSLLIFGGNASTSPKTTTQPEDEVQSESSEQLEEDVAEEGVTEEPQSTEEADQPEDEADSQPESQDEVEGETYEVQAGDTLYEIGLEFGINWEDIAEANDLEDGANLKPGDELIIPSQ